MGENSVNSAPSPGAYLTFSPRSERLFSPRNPISSPAFERIGPDRILEPFPTGSLSTSLGRCPGRRRRLTILAGARGGGAIGRDFTIFERFAILRLAQTRSPLPGRGPW